MRHDITTGLFNITPKPPILPVLRSLVDRHVDHAGLALLEDALERRIDSSWVDEFGLDPSLRASPAVAFDGG
jgi:hypothetical protein